jgi:hypothetical protein
MCITNTNTFRAPDYIRAGPRIDAEYFEFNRTDLFTSDGKYLSGLVSFMNNIRQVYI